MTSEQTLDPAMPGGDPAGAATGATPGSVRRDPRDEIVVEVRPWGQFERFTLNEPSTVKVITVARGQRLSLQRHSHRDELWAVLDGPLVVELDGQRRTVSAGEKVWIPRTTLHRVGATHDTDGRFLEIAFGTFDEDDIERLADDYQR